MHHIYRQYLYRLAAMAIIFLVFTLIAYLIGLPSPWVWSILLTILIQSYVRKII